MFAAYFMYLWWISNLSYCNPKVPAFPPYSLCFLCAAVHLLTNLRWCSSDGWSLPNSSSTENWHQSSWQRGGLPCQSSSPLEPRNRHGACTQTGQHTPAVVFALFAQVFTTMHKLTQKHLLIYCFVFKSLQPEKVFTCVFCIKSRLVCTLF